MKKRAFVRYSKQGKIVPGSLILTSGSYPSGPSTWNEVPADLCCQSISADSCTLDSTDSGSLASFPWNSDISIVIYCNSSNQYVFTYLPNNLELSSIEELVQYLNTYASFYGTFSVSSDEQSVILNLASTITASFADCGCNLGFEVFPN